MLWAVFAMMTSAVVLALARSLSERCESFGAHDSDVAFYRGLLAEADDDVRCGLVAPEDAVATRAEIGRRLLASLDSASESRPRAPRRWQARRAAAALAIVVVLPLVALASYLKVGAPSQPDMPIASRRTALPPHQRSDAIRGLVGGLTLFWVSARGPRRPPQAHAPSYQAMRKRRHGSMNSSGSLV